MSQFRLLQARTSDDPVREEERRSFAMRMKVPLDSVRPFDVLSMAPSADAACADVDGILVGGSGAFSVLDDVGWMRGFIDLVGEISELAIPMFASCFGFQALVLARGGEMRANCRTEIGTHELQLTPAGTSDSLFSALPQSFHAQEGHKDSAVRLPSGFIHLASSEACEYQAIRVANRPVWATQFHPELTGADNRVRMTRYLSLYQSKLGPEQTQFILDAHVPSPDANRLLANFAESVAG